MRSGWQAHGKMRFARDRWDAEVLTVRVLVFFTLDRTRPDCDASGWSVPYERTPDIGEVTET